MIIKKIFTGLAGITIMVAALTAAFIFQDIWASFDNRKTEGTQRRLNARLLDLAPNKWVKIRSDERLGWHRQAHSGIAFDSKRGTLLIFGSDTHGMNWDNSVHEFDPAAEKWTTHYPEAPMETYRSDEEGRAICGDAMVLPWAMHTYDNITYDPHLDAIVVTALPAHNPVKKKVPSANAATVHPTWIYDLTSHSWRIFKNKSGEKSPTFFAAGSAYDETRNVVMAYKNGGVWELGPDRAQWQRATKESHHEIHFNMVYNSIYRICAVFGNHKNTNEVWVYAPGQTAGEKGIWQKKIPGGDPCPRDQHFPVAVDESTGLILLLPDNNIFLEENGSSKPVMAESASTFIYDYKNNVYKKIPGGDFPSQKMNYMMVYDSFHKVFLLVTEDVKKPLTVWALKLDSSIL
ncbi:MAG: hypothetical protein V2B19_33075 [Pseudomonadota bacterium]